MSRSFIGTSIDTYIRLNVYRSEGGHQRRISTIPCFLWSLHSVVLHYGYTVTFPTVYNALYNALFTTLYTTTIFYNVLPHCVYSSCIVVVYLVSLDSFYRTLIINESYWTILMRVIGRF